MSRSTIAVVDSKRLLELFGTRDQHLRKIRAALDVGISARDGEIHIEGEDAAVHRATEIFESLDKSLQSNGAISAQIVDRLLNGNNFSEQLIRQESIEVHRPGGHIVPRSSGQADYARAIRKSDVVFCEGPAGCGKTFLAVAMAVSALRQEHVTKIVLVRPAVEAGESLGFLPGDLQAKINPYLRPLLDALREMMDFELLKKLTEQDVIEMIPLAYMRGRTLNDAFIILDEAQNTTAAQMKMFLTRLGVGSKMVISGDTTQIDLPSNRKSGLIDAMERLGEVAGCSKISLGGSDIVRHPLVQRIVDAYEE
ncbi:MAG: PhoH family protein [Pirellulales bacterium]|nr:PhoH family protein [Pirellulales bacterium]